jgi:multicomponent Na+:H+ antiporter subunit G
VDLTVAVGIALALGVLAAWIGAVTLLRLAPLGRIHAVSFVNVAAGAAVTLAAWLQDGPSPRSAKVLLAWIVLMLSGALSAHVTGRAIHPRDGERL